jgi:hypothetical protein
MQIHIWKSGAQSGPFPFDQIQAMARSGTLEPADIAWYQGCSEWIRLDQLPGVFPPGLASPPAFPVHALPSTSSEALIRQASDYARLSGILWIVLGVIQILTVVGAIAGGWNIYAGITRLSAAKLIMGRDPRVVAEFRSITGLVVIGVINLLLGGMIGLLFVAFDLMIRDKILANAHLFGVQPQPTVTG